MIPPIRCHILLQPSCSFLSTSFHFSSRPSTRTKSKEDCIDSLNQWFNNHQYKKDVTEQRKKLVNAYESLRKTVNYIHSSMNHGRLCCIGSAAAHSSSPYSDLDLVFIPSRKTDDVSKIHEYLDRFSNVSTFRDQQMRQMAGIINRREFMKQNLRILSHARVPILTGYTRNGVSFDIQFGNINCIQSSFLMRSAFMMDARTVHLVRWMKEMMLRQDIFGGRFGLFTSFHVSMMVLFFSQVHGVLPVLMEDDYYRMKNNRPWTKLADEIDTDDSPPSPPSSFTSSSLSSGELVIEMVNYFSSLDLTLHRLSVTEGKAFEEKTNNLIIVEPFFDSTRGVCAVKNGAVAMNKFFRNLSKLVEKEDWNGLLPKS